MMNDEHQNIDVPQLSISTSFDYGLPLDQQLRFISQERFSHVSFGSKQDHSSLLTPGGCKNIIRLLEENNLESDTIHGDMLVRPNAVETTIELIDVASELGMNRIVAHGGPFSFHAEALQDHLKNLIDNCNALSPILEDNGIRIALENVMPGPATTLVELALAELDPDYSGLCYDSSHDQIDGPRSFDLLKRYVDRVFAVHISDRIAPFIDHVLPGKGFIDWKKMCSTLRLVNYSEPVMLEVMMTHSKYRTTESFLKEAFISAKETWISIHHDNYI